MLHSSTAAQKISKKRFSLPSSSCLPSQGVRCLRAAICNKASVVEVLWSKPSGWYLFAVDPHQSRYCYPGRQDVLWRCLRIYSPSKHHLKSSSLSPVSAECPFPRDGVPRIGSSSSSARRGPITSPPFVHIDTPCEAHLRHYSKPNKRRMFLRHSSAAMRMQGSGTEKWLTTCFEPPMS